MDFSTLGPKTILSVIIWQVVLIGCNSTEEMDKQTIVNQYYSALDQSDSSKLIPILNDSLDYSVPLYDYRISYSSRDYIQNWFKWDSVFNPSYKILEISKKNGSLKIKISKSDRRILFLQSEPFVTEETVRFKNNKIASIEVEYLNFKDSTWAKNRTDLLDWINQYHPELDGFIYDQTKEGGLKYLKALELFESRIENKDSKSP